MEWLTNNWIWILVAIGVAWFLTRRGGMGCGMSHGTHTPGSAEEGGKGKEGQETAEAAKGKGAGHRHGGC